ncbi:major facilitator superfamily domain-containing protein [Delphinella strobiligena]|nr:major facilitator superfamily domain-containing protein [Delphinella strobiligena]
MTSKKGFSWGILGGRTTGRDANKTNSPSDTDTESLKQGKGRKKWTMGMLNDQETDEVPGSILLLSKVSNRNEPLGLQNAPARRSTSSLPSPFPRPRPRSAGSNASQHTQQSDKKKKTEDGKIVLVPQPDESLNDPLNWPKWRRDSALLSIGFYCMLGGGMTTVLAAGFNDVAADYDTTTARVALTTGLYMLGLGCGSVIASPTAILFGKRPVYLISGVIFVLTAVWCALSPNYPSLVVARVFMGLAVSPVECLPSASVAEIFFLHERAYRLGIYTLLLLGGKNLIPLVSAAIIESLGWRWVFWIVAMIVAFGSCLNFFFVPETFWDRTPRPHHWDQYHPRHDKPQRPRLTSNISLASLFRHANHDRHHDGETDPHPADVEKDIAVHSPGGQKRLSRHAHFHDDYDEKAEAPEHSGSAIQLDSAERDVESTDRLHGSESPSPAQHAETVDVAAAGAIPPIPSVEPNNATTDDNADYFGNAPRTPTPTPSLNAEPLKHTYTNYYRRAPEKSYLQTLKPYSGRLSHDNWFRVAFRPFVLFCYPSILWSAMLYALSVGWLIVISESVSTIYESRSTYGFTPLQAGLIYLSPFIGGILGTAVAGKISDLIVRFVSRRNGGIYEPEFRLIMAIPVAISTVIGLMGYGWSAEDRDAWIVPTVFFGIISFGCCLGSTTAITFAVDSYRQYAGEALVTLNFSKNIFHGLVFSLFFNKWLNADGAKSVFLALGGIQLGLLLFTIPMYIYGKRARMWTVRKNLMEKF